MHEFSITLKRGKEKYGEQIFSMPEYNENMLVVKQQGQEKSLALIDFASNSVTFDDDSVLNELKGEKLDIENIEINEKGDITFTSKDDSATYKIGANVIEKTNNGKSERIIVSEHVFNIELPTNFVQLSSNNQLNIKSLPYTMYNGLEAKDGIKTFSARNLHLLKIDKQIFVAKGTKLIPVIDPKFARMGDKSFVGFYNDQNKTKGFKFYLNDKELQDAAKFIMGENVNFADAGMFLDKEIVALQNIQYKVQQKPSTSQQKSFVQNSTSNQMTNNISAIKTGDPVSENEVQSNTQSESVIVNEPKNDILNDGDAEGQNTASSDNPVESNNSPSQKDKLQAQIKEYEDKLGKEKGKKEDKGKKIFRFIPFLITAIATLCFFLTGYSIFFLAMIVGGALWAGFQEGYYGAKDKIISIKLNRLKIKAARLEKQEQKVKSKINKKELANAKQKLKQERKSERKSERKEKQNKQIKQPKNITIAENTIAENTNVENTNVENSTKNIEFKFQQTNKQTLDNIKKEKQNINEFMNVLEAKASKAKQTVQNLSNVNQESKTNFVAKLDEKYQEIVTQLKELNTVSDIVFNQQTMELLYANNNETKEQISQLENSEHTVEVKKELNKLHSLQDMYNEINDIYNNKDTLLTQYEILNNGLKDFSDNIDKNLEKISNVQSYTKNDTEKENEVSNTKTSM